MGKLSCDKRQGNGIFKVKIRICSAVPLSVFFIDIPSFVCYTEHSLMNALNFIMKVLVTL